MTVDRHGQVFFDAGDPALGLLTKVDFEGKAVSLRTSVRWSQGVLEQSSKGTEPTGPGRLTADGRGGVFLAAGSRIVHVAFDISKTTLAGDPQGEQGRGPSESSGDGGPAQAATFANARSLASDELGNLVVADLQDPKFGSFVVRYLNLGAEPVALSTGSGRQVAVAPGHVERIAGSYSAGDEGADSAGTGSLQGVPPVMAIRNSTLYLGSFERRPKAERGGAKVTAINVGNRPAKVHGLSLEPGQSATLAGDGTKALGDGGSAPNSRLGYVTGLSVDEPGNLYIADAGHHRIRRVDPGGRITTYAGAGRGRSSGGAGGNNGPAIRALLNRPVDVKVDPAGRVYISDQGNRSVRVVDPDGIIRAAPGNGLWASSLCRRGTGDRLSKGERQLVAAPSSLATNPEGRVYFSNTEAHQIKAVNEDGVIRTVSGTTVRDKSCKGEIGCAGFRGDNGPIRSALLDRPTALSPVGDEGLYIFDSGNARIRYANFSDRPARRHGTTIGPDSIRTVAGNGKVGSAGDGGPASKAELGALLPLESGSYALHKEFGSLKVVASNITWGSLAPAPGGILFVTDSGQPSLQPIPGTSKAVPKNGKVRLVDATGKVSSFAGSGAPMARQGCCKDPTALAVDRAENLYVADRDTLKVWFINRGKKPITVKGQIAEPGKPVSVAGDGSLGFGGDGGRASEAQLLLSFGMAVDPHDNLYITQAGDSRIPDAGFIRKIDNSGKITLAGGNGFSDFNGDGLEAKLTGLSFPSGVAIGPEGDLFVADFGNKRLRHISIPAAKERLPKASRDTGTTEPFSGRALQILLLAAAAILSGIGAGVIWDKRRRSS